jgi:general stress protein 26
MFCYNGEIGSFELSGFTQKVQNIMQKDEALQQGLALVNRSPIAMLGTNGDNGYPNIKAMLNMEHEGLKRVWFSTNTSSRRVAQVLRDARACVYFVDFQDWMGLMLVGDVQVLQDAASKQRLWREGYERYYPLGVTDPDYSVLCFTARWGNFYHALSNVSFDL